MRDIESSMEVEARTKAEQDTPFSLVDLACAVTTSPVRADAAGALAFRVHYKTCPDCGGGFMGTERAKRCTPCYADITPTELDSLNQQEKGCFNCWYGRANSAAYSGFECLRRKAMACKPWLQEPRLWHRGVNYHKTA